MRLKENPIFRKVIVPWYDSESIRISLIICMIAVVVFSFLGIRVATEMPGYRQFMWVPVLLLSLSLIVLLSVIRRMLNRRRG
ncbi:MAG: hypothetical protein HKM93_13920 [Desulfobacteraceae bacterium]|nr:hypothetical protein [Desulfobacteraceae bacterium]